MTAQTAPIVSVVVRRYRPEDEAAFMRVTERIGAEVARRPGFAGLQTKRTERGDLVELVTVYAFDQRANMQRWEEAEARHRLMGELDRLSVEDSSQTRFSGLSILTDPADGITTFETVVILIFWILILAVLLEELATLALPGWTGGFLRDAVLISVNVLLISYLFLPVSSRIWARAKALLTGRGR